MSTMCIAKRQKKETLSPFLEKTLFDLPFDALEAIVSFLANRDFVSFISTCRLLRGFGSAPSLFARRDFIALRPTIPGQLFLNNVSTLRARIHSRDSIHPVSLFCLFSRLVYLSVRLKYDRVVYPTPIALPMTLPTSLRVLKLIGLSSAEISDMRFVAPLQDLVRLNLKSGPWKTIDALPSLPALTHLNLGYCRDINDFSPLCRCTGLVSLKARATMLARSEILSSCPGLTTIDLRDARISETAGFASLWQIKTLKISNKFYPIDNFDPVFSVATAANIESMCLKFCETLHTSWATFRNFVSLRNLNLSFCGLSTLDFLRPGVLPLLVDLKLDYNFFSDVTNLRVLPSLETLSLRGLIIEDIFPLCRCATLVSIDLRESRMRANTPSLAFLPKLRQINFAFSNLNSDGFLNFLQCLMHQESPIERVDITGTYASLEVSHSGFLADISQAADSSFAFDFSIGAVALVRVAKSGC